MIKKKKKKNDLISERKTGKTSDSGSTEADQLVIDPKRYVVSFHWEILA